MIIQRKINGKIKFIELTPEELKHAYEERRMQYREEDAKMRFLELFDDSPEDPEDVSEEEKKIFEDTFGFTVEEAVDPQSKHYFLDCVAERFIEDHDSNIADNDQWYNIIKSFLAFQKEDHAENV